MFCFDYFCTTYCLDDQGASYRNHYDQTLPPALWEELLRPEDGTYVPTEELQNRADSFYQELTDFAKLLGCKSCLLIDYTHGRCTLALCEAETITFPAPADRARFTQLLAKADDYALLPTDHLGRFHLQFTLDVFTKS